MTKTGNQSEINRLNHLLGTELGFNVYGAPIFSWRWSEDCFWPAARTGRMITQEHEVQIPIIGTGTTETAVQSDSIPEYKRGRQVRARDQWLIAKWQSPEELIVGGLVGHGMGWQGGVKPSHEALVATWARLYPGADFPAQGWRVPTDATLPRGPYDPSVPNEPDTRFFIHRVREQTSMGFEERLQDMLDSEDFVDAQKEKLIGEECRDAFPAYLNNNVGKRGGWISMPWTKKDRL